MAGLQLSRKAFLACGTGRGLRRSPASPAARRVEPVFPRCRVRPQHSAVNGPDPASPWNLLDVEAQAEEQPTIVRALARTDLQSALAELNLNVNDLNREIGNRLEIYGDDATLDIRGEGYRQLSSGMAAPEAEDFEVRNVTIPERLRPFFARVGRVARLREVRALHGFTRTSGCRRRSRSLSAFSRSRGMAPGARGSWQGEISCLNQKSLRFWEKRDCVIGARPQNRRCMEARMEGAPRGEQAFPERHAPLPHGPHVFPRAHEATHA